MGDHRQRVDDGRAIHPQLDTEGHNDHQIAVAGRQAGHDDAAAKAQQADLQHQRHAQQQHTPVRADLAFGKVDKQQDEKQCKLHKKVDKPEITVEIGMASRGKYTLLKMLEFVVNVPDTLLMQDEKKPHSAVPAR